MSSTDTNQASKEVDRILAKYEIGFVTHGKDVNVHVANFKKELYAIIRTEKLKLLEEVIHQSTVNLKSAKAVAGWGELRKEQLEAEL